MRTIFQPIIITIAAAIISINASAQISTTTFWVAGICGMCEETIEKAMDAKGIVSADYNLETNKLTVSYKPKKISEEQLHKLINDVGYDTEKSACTDEQYKKVHGCCQYRQQEKH